jgi:D-alanine-D-alanine ligase
MKIALVYNLKRIKPNFKRDDEAEFDSQKTIQEIKNSLEKWGKHKAYLVEADENAYLKLKQLKNKIDLVFNIAEGKHGEAREAQIPAILEMLKIPYTGSGPLTLAICLDKALTKEILLYHKIPTSKFQLFLSENEPLNKQLKFPLFVKPNAEGSSKGIFFGSVFNNEKDLRKRIRFIIKKYKQGALVEEYLPGREFSVAILGNKGSEQIFPIMELDFSKNLKGLSFDSFESKHIWELPENFIVCPAKISFKLEKKIKDICLKTFRVLGCRDLARIDLRLDKNGVPNILEINPLPAIGDRLLDGYPKAALTFGLNYEELINKIVEVACLRYHLRYIKIRNL